MESKRLAKCMLAYVDQHRSEVDTLLQLLGIFTTTTRVNFDFLKRFLAEHIVSAWSLEEKRAVSHNTCLRLAQYCHSAKSIQLYVIPYCFWMQAVYCLNNRCCSLSNKSSQDASKTDVNARSMNACFSLSNGIEGIILGCCSREAAGFSIPLTWFPHDECRRFSLIQSSLEGGHAQNVLWHISRQAYT